MLDISAQSAKRTRKPMIAGIMSILVGGIDATLAIAIAIVLKAMPEGWQELGWLVIVIIVPAVVAMVGGVFAIKRKNYGMALAGAICSAVSPGIVLGMPSIILLVLSEKEFIKTPRLSPF